eukprot:2518818-Rhodomonas_salina.1
MGCARAADARTRAAGSTGDLAWFLDLYPNGYKNPNYIAVYLHSGVSSKDARSARVPFSLLVFDNHAQQFVTCANLCQTFDKTARCWGKHSLKKKVPAPLSLPFFLSWLSLSPALASLAL